MGVDLQTYRCRIAKGCAIMAKINAARECDHHTCDIPFVVHSKPWSTPVWLCLAYVTVVVTLLLLMAGVEPNPGPGTSLQVQSSPMDNPYSKEVQNGLRLSALLINEGTSALQREFNKQLHPKYNNLKHALSSNKTKLNKYYCGKPKLLDDNQYQLLYPANNKPDSSKFDVTLLTFLFRNLICLPCPTTPAPVPQPLKWDPWKEDPEDSDKSLSAELVRIRKFRNSFYAHIATTGIEDTQFEIHWDRLSALLKRLNVSSTVIDKWKTECMTEHHMLKQKFERLMARDVEDMQALMASTKCLLEKFEQYFDHQLSKVPDAVSEIKTENNEYDAARESNFTSLLSVLSALPIEISQTILSNSQSEKAVPEMEKQLRILLGKQGQVLQNTEDIKEGMKDSQKTNEKIEDSVSKLSDKIDKLEISSKENGEKGDVIIQKILKIKMDEKRAAPQNSSLTHLIDALKQDGKVFKVLIINKPDLEKLSHMEELCHTLGCASWDVVVDLNYYSRTKTGLHNAIANQLRKLKDFKVINYKEFSTVTDDDKETIAKGMRTLWILCNGCTDTQCEEPTKFGKTITEITPLLKNVLSKLAVSSKSVVVLNIIMGNDNKRNMRKICECIADVCEGVEEQINFKDSCMVQICLHEEFRDMIPDVDFDLEQMNYSLSCNQLIDALSDCFSIETKSEKFYYPGESTWCSLSSENMTKLTPYAVLYHRDIGKIDFTGQNSSEIEKIYDRIIVSFLKGNPLTPEGLYVQEKCPVFVVRKEMKYVAETIENNLKDWTVWSKKNQEYYTIGHAASGGGTTVSTYLLYTLREKYPCLLVKKIDENLITLLIDLYNESKKTLLIVVDDHRYESNDISTLQRRLQNKFVKCLVVYVRRVRLTEKYANSPNYCFISSKLNNGEDVVAFKKLYGQVKKKINTDKVFMFGLYAFCEEYAPLNEIVTGRMAGMTEGQKNIILAVYYIKQYGNVSTPSMLWKNLISSDRKSSLADILGSGNDLICFDKEESNIWPAHKCVFKPLMRLLSKTLSRKDICKKFIKIMFQMFSKNTFSKTESMQIWIQLFIKRDYASHFFTVLIQDLEQYCGKEYVVETLMNSTSLYDEINKGQHPRSLYARYLFYEVKNEKEGIEQIGRAVGVLTSKSIMNTDSTDQTLITTYGSMFKAKAYNTFQNYLQKKDVEGGLKVAVMEYQEAAHAFSLAQRLILDNTRPRSSLNHASVQAFLGEAKARSTLLGLCFNNKCKEDHEEFHIFLKQTKNSFIHESLKKIHQVLNQLDIAIRLDKVHDNDPIKTNNEILKLQFKILRMQFDESNSKAKLMATVQDDVPYDYGLLMRLNGWSVTSRCKKWDELSPGELEFLISKIDKQIETDHMLNINYYNILRAMLILRNSRKIKKFRKYNLNYALFCAEQWLSKSPNEPNAYFYCGCLKFVKGIESQGNHGRLLIEEAVVLLKSCSELYKSNPSAKYMNTIYFTVGVGPGLEKLIPYKSPDIDNDQCYTFYGRQKSKSTVTVKLKPESRPIDQLTAKIPWDKDLRESDINQQPNLKFNLKLRMTDPFIAVNVERLS